MPASIERSVTSLSGKLNGREKIKNPLNSSVIFCDFPKFPKFLEYIIKNRPNPSAHQKIVLRKQGVLFFWNSSAFVRFWEMISNFVFLFFSHFPETHFSWISTESGVLWCIGGPQILFAFLRFLFYLVSRLSSLFSYSLRGHGKTTASYCKTGEFHSHPRLHRPVQKLSETRSPGHGLIGVGGSWRENITSRRKASQLLATPKPSHNKPNHPNVPSWVISLWMSLFF